MSYLLANFAELHMKQPLYHCKRAQKIWHILFPSLNCFPADFNLTFLNFLNYISDNLHSNEKDIAAITCWAIWNNRNSALRGIQTSPPAIKSEWMRDYLTNFLPAQMLNKVPRNRTTPSTAHQWKPPSNLSLKLITDAACRGDSIGLGFIIQESSGALIAAKVTHLPYKLSPLFVEIRGILEGLRFAVSSAYPHIEVESDSLMAIHLIQGELHTMGEKGSWLMEIKALIPKFDSIFFHHTPRHCNFSVHSIANWGTLSPLDTWCWQNDFPPWLLRIVQGSLM